MTTHDEFDSWLAKAVPMYGTLGAQTELLTPDEVVIRVPEATGDMVRPGGTVSGPVMFALADVALYGLVLATAGRVELAVTTDMTIHFLRKPAMTGLVARAKPLKAGRRLFIGECNIYSEGLKEPVAHVVGTYSIPPTGEGG